MIDDTGFKRVRVRVLIPGLQGNGPILHKLFENPELSATLLEAGNLGGCIFLDVEVFGVASEVDRALGPRRIEAMEESPAHEPLVESGV
jgi:hypothetical protein